MADYKISFHYDNYLFNMETLPTDNPDIINKNANKMIIETMKRGIDLKTQIKTYDLVIRGAIKKLRNDEYVSKLDKRLCSLGLISLIKLKNKINDENNGYLILKNKSKIKAIDPAWLQMVG